MPKYIVIDTEKAHKLIIVAPNISKAVSVAVKELGTENLLIIKRDVE